MAPSAILLVSCSDAKGEVASISDFALAPLSATFFSLNNLQVVDNELAKVRQPLYLLPAHLFVCTLYVRSMNHGARGRTERGSNRGTHHP